MTCDRVSDERLVDDLIESVEILAMLEYMAGSAPSPDQVKQARSDTETSRTALIKHLRSPVTVSDCWEWQGTKFDAGYGAFQSAGKTLRAHRVVYEALRGPIPEGLVLDHLCRNRGCVNPWHLEAVTLEENILRGESLPAQNARKTHCLNGHEFTDENTWNYQGRRVCKACRKENNRKHMRAYRARAALAGSTGNEP